MNEVIIREGEQITISAKEYYDLLVFEKIGTIALIILGILIIGILLYIAGKLILK